MPSSIASYDTKETNKKKKKKDFLMPKSKVWPAPLSVMSFNLHLCIQEINYLPVDKGEDCDSSSYVVQIEWRGSKRTSLIPRGFKRNCTEKQQIQRSGALRWNEEFDHTCKLKKLNTDRYRGWIINLEVQEIGQKNRGKTLSVGKAKVDVAEFALKEAERSTKVPINCSIMGHAAEAVLMIKLRFTKLQKSSSTVFTLPRALSLRTLSCTRPPQTYSSRFQYPRKNIANYYTVDSSSDDEPDFDYGKLAITNFLLVDQFPGKLDDNQQMQEIAVQQQRLQQQPSLIRILSRNKSKNGFKEVSNCRGPPLLNKESEDGGDDIDHDRRHQSSFRPLRETKVLPEKSLQFEDNNRFEVGKWEKHKIVSRDGELELVTDVFFASIDQRSDRAAGGGACTVLATIIAHWLHDNPKILPLRCQFDELVHEGSLEWRKLCENENHKEKFSDQHFDLETVLEAKVRPLAVVTDKSYVSFFSLDNAVRSSEFLQDATSSFDSIWRETVRMDAAEERVYIASWNDHFFVLKVERDVIYLIDTLGERLFEGCNQAYILKFDEKSAVSKRCADEDHNIVAREAFSEGMDSCRDYIKGFLAAVPLRELQHELEIGRVEEALLHRKLQIEFHYTKPSKDL